MPDFTTNQWVVLALVLILGWLLGLYMMSGGRKWRRSFEQERAARIAADAECDRLSARVVDLEGERDRRIALEQERDRNLALAVASSTNPAVPLDSGQRGTGTAHAMGSMSGTTSGQRDDLSLIFGVGRGGEIKLNELGIYRYAQIISLSGSDQAELEDRMGIAPKTIENERWQEQAAMLRKGQFDEHARMFA